jgi:hypothetical protein
MNVAREGPVGKARQVRVSEDVIAFEHGPLTGSLSPVGELQGPVGATPSAPRVLAEHLVAQLASSIGYAAQQCAEALEVGKSSS